MPGTLDSGRPGGNPEFGTKYKFQAKGDEPLSEAISVRLTASVKQYLESLGKNYPEFVREAIAEKIERHEAAETKTVTTEQEQTDQPQLHNQTIQEDQEEETDPSHPEQEAGLKKQRKAGQTQGQKQGKPTTRSRSQKNTLTEN
ncbi:hypothetical protein VB735_17835 [Halotia wernerae UHCC 0503]|nr:hypothetical protein [Halotia wernerae UHCC 0503]